MENRKRGIWVFLFATLMLFVAGCSGDSGLGPLPTLAPTHTPVPVEDKPSPTVAPDAEYTKIIELNGEDFNQTSHFMIEGEGTLSVKPVANSGAYSFCMSGRGEPWHAVSLAVADKEGNKPNVVGKNLYLAMWVYHETGKGENFSATLQVKAPDGSLVSAAVLTKNGVPSHTWTLVQGMMPVYANVTEPRIRIEMTSGNEAFNFDDFRITYDENSFVDANTEYNVSSFEGMYFGFDDGQNGLIGRAGTEKLTVVNGGAAGSSKSLHVSGRTASWNGAAIDLSSYGLAGSDIWVSYSVNHNSKKGIQVKCVIQELAYGVTDESKATYAVPATSKRSEAGHWVDASGKCTLKANSEKIVLYFEADGTEEYYIDNVIIATADPATLEVDKETGKLVEKVNRMDTTGFKTLYSLDADGIGDETSMFILNDGATVESSGTGHSQNGFKVSNRKATWCGVGLQFERDGFAKEVIGKQVYVSFWVYQDSGKNLDFSATLQVKKPDGTDVWPERVALGALPSGKWTFVEGLIPIYANVTAPQINFEMPTSADVDYYIDDITIAYNPNSKVPANKSYADAAKEEKTSFETLVLDFEDNNAFFNANGNGKPTIVYGGYESDKCLFVSGRKQNWHGVKADFSKYDIIGKNVKISFRMYHEYDTPLEIILSAEQNDGTNTNYFNVIRATAEADGKWAYFDGEYSIPAGTKKIYFYFESQNETAEFYLDDITFEIAE